MNKTVRTRKAVELTVMHMLTLVAQLGGAVRTCEATYLHHHMHWHEDEDGEWFCIGGREGEPS